MKIHFLISGPLSHTDRTYDLADSSLIQVSGSLTSVSHQQLLRGGVPVRVLVFPWSDDIDAVGAF